MKRKRIRKLKNERKMKGWTKREAKSMLEVAPRSFSLEETKRGIENGL